MKKILTGLIVLGAVLLVVRGWWGSQLDAVSSDKTPKEVVIAKGAGLSQIAEQLKKEGLIKSPLLFKFYTYQKGLGSRLQAGLFRLSPSMTTSEIVKILSEGPEGVWVKLLEGWRLEEQAEEVNKQLKIDKKEFLRLSQEGYNFPDSYLFPREATAGYVVDTLTDTFESRYSDELKKKIRSQGLTEEEGVILASIVEREARSEKVRVEVASILLKRLKIGMGLNADATIQYALGYQRGENPPAGGWWKRHLSLDDLKIDSPYNTYTHSGLPPAPICNPGLSSLKAVANADSSTPYLYYYHDSKGNSYYGKTLEEHNKNVANHP